MATRCAMQRIAFSIFIIFISLTNISKVTGTPYVTYSSVLKLLNVDYKVRLHSHDVKYGSGSGQQSVTATELETDANSYWFVKGPTKMPFTRGKPIKCGDTVRFEHVNTKKNLHSHLMRSPLSGKQEVSAYGDQKGEGDSGDHWMVVCNSDYWERREPVTLQHIDTQVFLSVSGRSYGSPIAGQMEVVGEHSVHSGYTQWQAMEGLFINPTNLLGSRHDEL
ncbi:stromal cell-derived factor 2-like protein 1 [Microplitis mediator]|uniref:stromal cell-derived factor 2-like protein 1 n=1 Tax=Microplitis mediator TaxID=375433 RepID=UPI00255681A8|nr:stromal cell-derived factor 2-like protein 1 [Microplitis mediator]